MKDQDEVLEPRMAMIPAASTTEPMAPVIATASTVRARPPRLHTEHEDRGPQDVELLLDRQGPQVTEFGRTLPSESL